MVLAGDTIELVAQFRVLAKRIGQFLASRDYVHLGAEAGNELIGYLGEVRGSGVDDDVSAGAQDIGGVITDLNAEIAPGAYDLAEVFAELGGIDVDGADDSNLWLLQHEAHHGRTDWTHAVLNHTNFVPHEAVTPDSIVLLLSAAGQSAILHPDSACR